MSVGTRAGAALLLLLLSPCAALLRPRLIRPPLHPAPRLARTAAAVARYEDDPWLTSGKGQPLSGESLEVLFRYGPVIYGSRCFDTEEYNASCARKSSRILIPLLH